MCVAGGAKDDGAQQQEWPPAEEQDWNSDASETEQTWQQDLPSSQEWLSEGLDVPDEQALAAPEQETTPKAQGWEEDAAAAEAAEIAMETGGAGTPWKAEGSSEAAASWDGESQPEWSESAREEDFTDVAAGSQYLPTIPQRQEEAAEGAVPESEWAEGTDDENTWKETSEERQAEPSKKAAGGQEWPGEAAGAGITPESDAEMPGSASFTEAGPWDDALPVDDRDAAELEGQAADGLAQPKASADMSSLDAGYESASAGAEEWPGEKFHGEEDAADAQLSDEDF